MSTDMKSSNDRNPAAGRDARKVAPLKTRRELSLELTPHKPRSEQRSPDPYNTSGSFDRTKNWTRVGKR